MCTVQRMPEERLPKAVFFSELAGGTRPVGRPKKRFKDHLQDTMKRCNINPGGFEDLANDRSAWKQAVRGGTEHYETTLREKSDQQRRARHHALTRGVTPVSGYDCDSSHMRAHQRALQRQR